MRKIVSALVATTLLLALAGPLLAAKGGNGKPGGGGGEPPADPEIAYVDKGDLMVMNADGTNKTVVYAGDSNDDIRWPTWSPDGQTLLFSSDVLGIGIYTIELDGTGLTKVVSLAGGLKGRSAWSPVALGDGEFKIAYLDQAMNGDGSPGEFDIFLVSLDGTGRVNLTNTADRSESMPTWSPDGSRLAFVQYHGAVPDVVSVDLVMVTLDANLGIAATVNLTDESGAPGGPLNAYNANLPVWERSGDRIAVSALVNGERDVWSIDVDDPSSPLNVSDSDGLGEDAPSWSPTGDRIVCMGYGATRRKDNGIYVLDAVTGASTQIVASTSAHAPSWRP